MSIDNLPTGKKFSYLRTQFIPNDQHMFLNEVKHLQVCIAGENDQTHQH